MHTVAAGGGSILAYDGMRFGWGLRVPAPIPGPCAATGAGGPLTVTDANVMLGKLRPEFFHAHLRRARGRTARPRPRGAGLPRACGGRWDGRTAPEVADGFVRIAVENMARAIKRISVERGYDVTEYALSCFGAAGGQHAALIAETLGMRTVLVHPFSGVLSAYGIGISTLRASREHSLECKLDAASLEEARRLTDDLDERVRLELEHQGAGAAEIKVTRHLNLRYAGSEMTLPVVLGGLDAMRAQFDAMHLARFGFTSPEKEIFIAHAEVQARWRGTCGRHRPRRVHAARGRAFAGAVYSKGAWHDARVMTRAEIAIGASVPGPLLVIEANQTVVVEPGWAASRTEAGSLVLTRADAAGSHVLKTERAAGTPDPVLLEVFNNRFTGNCRQMGEALRNPRSRSTSRSGSTSLRALRWGGQSRRQCTARARASRQHGCVGEGRRR